MALMASLLAGATRACAAVRGVGGSAPLETAALQAWLPAWQPLASLACGYAQWLKAKRASWGVATRRRVPTALQACERLRLQLAALLQTPPRGAVLLPAIEASRAALIAELHSGWQAEAPAPEEPTPPPPAAPPSRGASRRKQLRSRNAFVDAQLASGEYADDSFADLEDFIVCKRGRQY